MLKKRPTDAESALWQQVGLRQMPYVLAVSPIVCLLAASGVHRNRPAATITGLPAKGSGDCRR